MQAWKMQARLADSTDAASPVVVGLGNHVTPRTNEAREQRNPNRTPLQ